MATKAEVEQALRKAHEAGDIEAAKVLAQHYASMPNDEPAQDDNSLLTKNINNLRGIAGGFHQMATALNPFATEEDLAKRKAEQNWINQHPEAALGQMLSNGVAAVPAAMAFPELAGSMAGSGLIGGIQSALTTPGSFNDRSNAGLQGMAGGTIGQGLGNLAGKVIPASINTVKGVVGNFTDNGQQQIISRLLKKVVGEGNINDVVRNLDNAAPVIPGSNPTAAEVAKNGGIAALQRSSMSANPAEYTKRALEQGDARIASLQGIAKTEDDLQRAIAFRKDTANQGYTAAGQQPITINEQLAALLQHPAVKSAQDAPISPYVLDSRGTPMINVATGQRLQGQTKVEDLHNLKVNLDRDANFNPTTSADKRDQAGIIASKQKLVDLLEQQSPDYKAARLGYIANSAPIEQMKLGQDLLNKVQPALSDYGQLGGTTAATYARAIKDAKGNYVKNVNGGIDKKLSDVMTPEQMATIKNVAVDLGRRTNAQNLGREAGSNTHQNFAMDDLASQTGLHSGLLSMLLTKTPFVKGAMKGAEQDMQQKIASLLLDPKATAALLKQQPELSGAIESFFKNKALQPIPGIMGANSATELNRINK